MKNFSLIVLLINLAYNSQVLAIDLGPASPYNAFVFEEFSAPSSDVEGRLAAGGDVSINNYSVGDKLDPQTLTDVLISGGDITFPSGRVYYGNILASGNVAGVGAPVLNGMQNGAIVQGNTTLPVNFNQAYDQLSHLSTSLSNLAVNTNYESQWGGLYLHGDCASNQQVFNLDGATVLSAHTFQVDCIPNDAYVIFNISGTDVGLTNMSLSSLVPHRQRVIFNFYQAQNLTLTGIGVEGTILAVNANINNPQGVIKGQLIAKSWNGMMQLNHEPFINDVTQTGNQAPIAEDQRFEIQAQQQLNFTLQATDPNGDELAYNLLSLPQYGQLIGEAPNLIYTPNDNFNGVDTLTYTVSDAEFTTELVTVTFSIGLEYCKIYPYALEHQQLINLQIGDQVNNYSTSVGQGNYSLLSWNGANDTNTLAESFTQPGNSENYINPDDNSDTTIDVNDWIQGVPGKKNASHVRNALDLLIGESINVPLWSQIRGSGSNFDYQVGGFANIILTDYKLNGQSNISFEFLGLERCLNYAPVSYSNEFTTAKNSAKNITLTDENSINNTVQNLLAVFDANDDELTYIITNPPTNGILSGTGPDFTYIPNNDFVGSDEFSFKVNDGYGDSNESIVSITVEDSNTAPVADDQNIITLEDQVVSIELTATDADNDNLNYQVVTQPLNGTLSGTAPNLVYAPNADFHGSDSFTFSANDGSVDSSLATVSINITPVNDAPNASSLDITTDEDTSVNITLSGTDVDNDTFTYTIITQPLNGSLTGTLPNLDYLPNDNYNGIDSFTYSINDGTTESTAVAVFITINAVNDVPVANNQNISTTENTSVNIILSGSDIDGDLLTYNIINPAQYGSITGTLPDLVYTPNTDYSGLDTFTFVSNDGQSQSNQSTISITITENPNTAPVAEDQNINTLEDQQISIVLTATDTDNDVLNYQIVTQPLNGSLSGTAPDLVYTPNPDFNGADSLSYLANDGISDSSLAIITIAITPVNDAPVATPLDISTDEDTSVNITLSATDVDSDALTYTITTQPTNGVLSGTAPDLIYLPSEDYNGIDSFSYLVNDGTVDSTIVDNSILINAVNDVPVADNQTISTTENTSVNILLSGADADGDSLTFSIINHPQNGTITGTSPDVIYTPNTGYYGADSFTFVSSDGQSQSNQSIISINITENPNNAPVAEDQSITTLEDQELSITLNATDADNDTLTFQVFSQPANGSLSGTAPNLIYIPNADFNGSDSFTYSVNDGIIDSVIAAVSIAVNPVNDVPTVNDATVSTNEDTNLTVTLSGADIDGDTLSYQVVVQPSNGDLNGTAPDLIYTPNADFNGSDSFSYLVNDGTVDSITATVTITINAVNDAPVADELNVTTQYQTSVDITLSASDIEDVLVTFQIQDQPQNGVIIENEGIYTFTPNNGFFGNDQASFVALDSELLSSTVQLINITVEENANLPPEIITTAPTSGVVGVDILYDADATDPNDDMLTYLLNSSPDSAAQDPLTGMINWLPTFEYSAGIQTDNPYCTLPSLVEDSVQKIQTVTFVDTSSSMSNEQIFIGTWLSQLNGQLLGAGMGNAQSIDYGLTVFGSYFQYLPLADGQLLSDLTAITNTLIPVNELPPMGFTEDGIDPMLAAIDGSPVNSNIDPYPFSEGSSKSFIMFSDEPCQGCQSLATTNQFKQRILEEKIVVHSVIGATLQCENGMTALGYDSNSIGYVADGSGDFYKCNIGEPVTSANTLINYIEPALISGGSVWNIRKVESDEMTRQSLSKAMSEVISQITIQQVSQKPASDLYIDSNSIIMSDASLQLNVGNRGLSDSGEFNIFLNDSHGIISTQNSLSLPANDMVSFVFDITGINKQDLNIQIQSEDNLNECIINNNNLKLSAFDFFVSDAHGGEDSQSFVIKINETQEAPIINNIGTIQALSGQPLDLAIIATDANKGDDLRYQLTQGNTLASLDSKSGVFSWIPDSSLIGTIQSFSIEVTDLSGLSDSQSFEIEILPGVEQLSIVSMAPKLAVIETEYNYLVIIESDPTAIIDYELLAEPDGMSISSSGEVSWQVPLEELDKAYTVVIRATDQFGNIDVQAYRLIVDEAAQAPKITSIMINTDELTDGFGHFSTYTDINALEAFTHEYLSSPSGLQFYSAEFPYDNFNYELTVRHLWRSPYTQYPDGKFNANHWCSLDDRVNLAPQISESVIVSPSQSFNDAHQTNLLVSSIFDSNQDGELSHLDDQYIIFNRNFGISAINAKTLTQEWFQPNVRASIGKYARSLAVEDLDNDGIKEVIVLDNQGYLNALSSQTGELIWKATQGLAYWSYTQAIVYTDDIDSDGNIEVIAGTNVYNSDGSVKISMGQSNYLDGPTYIEVSDLNHDGLKELLYNDKVYDHNGVIIYNGLGDGNYYTTANFDLDPELEWTQVNLENNTLRLFDHDATLLWQVELFRASYPSIADVNQDGQLDIIMNYAMVSADGTVIRNEDSTRNTSSRLTDINHDGAYELASNDQGFLIIKSPITGDEIVRMENNGPSYDFTLIDRFGNGEYQILLPTYIRTNGEYGFNFIKSADDHWTGGVKETVSSRRVGNNSTTSNLWLDQIVENNLKVDLHVSGAQLEKVSDGEQLYTELRNITPSTYSGDIQVDFYSDGVHGLTLMESKVVSSIGPHETIRVSHSQSIDPDSFEQSTFIVEATPLSPVVECRTDNNKASSEFVYWQVTDSTGFFDRQAYNARLKKEDIQPFFVENLPSAIAWQEYSTQLSVRNYTNDNDDVFFFSKDIPQGMHISSTGLITWIPTENQVGTNPVKVEMRDDGGLGRVITVNIAVMPSNNQAPYITSTAESSVTVAEEYQYQVIAIEPDGDSMSYQLLDSPTGATISNNGLILWTPQEVTHHDESFTVKVIDPHGGFVSQNFLVRTIAANNTAPIITSTPATNVINGNSYLYQVFATDAEGDSIRYSLIQAPFGVSLNLYTGLLEWTQTTIGAYSIIIKATDSNGAWSYQKYNLYVNTESNTAPVITSTPSTSHSIGIEDYNYQVTATDADADVLSYRLINAPIGMVLDASSGLLTWPANKQISGTLTIIVEVSDGQGGISVQEFELTMGSGNNAPSITSLPVETATQNRLYQYQITAVDADSPVLLYSLIAAPEDMLIDQNGLISWTPRATGILPIVVQVSDGTSIVRQSWLLTVEDNINNLDAQIIVTPQKVEIGADVALSVNVINPIGIAVINVDFEGTAIVLDANNQAIINSNIFDTHIITATITDDVETIIVQSAFVVEQDVDLQPPVIDILSPVDGDSATGFVDIQIRVQDNNLSQWQLSYRDARDPEGTAPRTLIANGNNEVNDAVVVSWDTSLLRNGIYVLVLEAIDTTGLSSNIANSIFLEGDLKLGHFQIAFEDLNIPVAGIPVTISRSYDTRDRNTDRDFGKGWSIGHQALELTESRVPGQGWYMVTESYNFGPVRLPRYCVEPIGDRLVSIRMPDGKLEKFKFKAKTNNPSADGRLECQDITPPDLFEVTFEAQGDTTSTLSTSDINTGLRITNGNLQTLLNDEPIDPNKYILTLQDGTVYFIDQGFNLTGIETTSGHSLEFTHDGITHADGYAVAYIRDAQDRIIAIQKPNGDEITYTYDANGDLESHTDLLGNTTTFTYIQDHYLEDINDPRGIRVARNEYDNNGRLVAHIDAEGNRIEYTHDIAGRTESIKDRNGNVSTFVYDNAGSVIAETNALGETTYHEYNQYRLETKRIDPLGNETIWTYDNQGNQLTETDALGNTITSSYNAKGEILTQTDPAGNVVIDNQYNPDYDPQLPSSPQHGYGQLKTVTDALGNTTEFHWLSGVTNPSPRGRSVTVSTGFTDAAGNRFTIEALSDAGVNTGLIGSSINLNGLKVKSTFDDESRPLTRTQVITDDNDNVIAEYITSYEYNANGDVVKTTDPLGNISLTEFNSINKVSAVIDSKGSRIEYEYDNRGNPIKTIYSDGTFESTEYDLEGNEISKIDRLGRKTQYIFDAANRVVEEIKPDETPIDDSDNPRILNTYDKAGRVVSVSDANGNITYYEYDAVGQQTKIIDALGNETSFVYNSLGRKIQTIDALGRVAKFEYDLLGNRIKTIYPDNTPNDDNDNLFTSITFDNLSRKISQTDLAGRITKYEYNNAGDLTVVIDPLGQRTEYTYDQRSNKLTQKDANNHVTSWIYDELGRISSRSLPEGQVEYFTYDSEGNIASKTDFNGDQTLFAYNNLNQLISTSYPDNTAVYYSYNPIGKISSIIDVHGITSYQYNVDDKLKRINYPNGNSIDYEYDLNGNRIKVKTANQTINYTFDALNRLSDVISANGGTNYFYDSVGNRSIQANSNGTIVTYEYNLLNRLVKLEHFDPNNNIIASYSYTLDANGNRKQIVESNGRIVNYSYNDLNRLIAEDIIDLINGNHSSTFEYDLVGNRLQQTIDGLTTTYSYDSNDLLLNEIENSTVISYIYDQNGNNLSKSINGILNSSFVYNMENQMIQANTPSNNISYTYDVAGIRQSKSIDGLITNYLVDPTLSYTQVLEEQDENNNTNVIYLYGDDLISQSINGSSYTYGYDGLGSTRIMTDINGTVHNSYGYHAYGEIDYLSETVVNNYLYTGEQLDDSTGLYYLRARYYNPMNGRFTSMDTYAGSMNDPITLHKYLYANANPAMYTDPSGNVGLIDISAAGYVRSAISGYSTRAGVTAIAKFTVEFAFEYATGIPVITSPKNLLKAVGSLKESIGDLAHGYFLKKFKGGRNFEANVAEVWGDLKKNTKCYKNGIQAKRPGCFIPDFKVTQNGRIVEVKTSGGALKKDQFQEFVKISQRGGNPLSLIFLNKPTKADIEKMQRWASEVISSPSDEILVKIVHVLDK